MTKDKFEIKATFTINSKVVHEEIMDETSDQFAIELCWSEIKQAMKYLHNVKSAQGHHLEDTTT